MRNEISSFLFNASRPDYEISRLAEHHLRYGANIDAPRLRFIGDRTASG
jgi:hypothetical protein